MLSFWEKSELLHYDLIVLGGGITGLFCALSYRKKYPKARIAVLERGPFSSGASTKNAGFACFGSLSELIEDNKKMDEKTLCSIVEMRWKGLALLRETLGDASIDLQWKGGYELFFEQNPQALSQLDYYNSLLKPLFKKEVFYPNNSKIKHFGFDSKKVTHLVENPFEGQLNTGKMMRALRSKINREDISFFSNSSLSHYETNRETKKLWLHVENQSIKMSCSKLALCTNAFTKQFLPDLNLTPGRGLVIITKPIKKLQVEGAFHYDQGYYYFRNIENRILFGGGRNVDFETENTTIFGINKKIKDKLQEDLSRFILPNQNPVIDMEWSGIMAFGEDKNPIIKKKSDTIVVGAKLGGMGVAIGSQVGKQLAELLTE